MKIGLIGLSNSGKTTIFNALTKSEVPVSIYTNSKAEPNLAVVPVLDERVLYLSKMYKPKKTTYATVEIADFGGITEDSAGKGLFSTSSLGLIKSTHALALVVRNFHDDLMGAPTPLQDMEQIDIELQLSDLVIIEKRLERIKWHYKRGQKSNTLLLEEKTLGKIMEKLNNNQPSRDLKLAEDEEKSIRGFQFLTRKPLMVILNSDETNFGKNQDLLSEITRKYMGIEFIGNFEMELSRLNDNKEVEMFMKDMGIQESARDRLTQLAYQILGYLTFFTVGSDEVRAWNIYEGMTVVEAAGTIHTDLARGFIRAECFSYNDLIELGSEKKIREKGRFRLEGKDYIVRDGDILAIRFNV